MPRPVGAASYIVKRKSNEGTYVDGVYQEASESSIRIIASVQPMDGDLLEQMPEGTRLSASVSIWTESDLNSVETGGTEADVLIYNGNRYEIQKEFSHNSHAPIPHNHFGAVRSNTQVEAS